MLGPEALPRQWQVFYLIPHLSLRTTLDRYLQIVNRPTDSHSFGNEYDTSHWLSDPHTVLGIWDHRLSVMSDDDPVFLGSPPQ